MNNNDIKTIIKILSNKAVTALLESADRFNIMTSVYKHKVCI